MLPWRCQVTTMRPRSVDAHKVTRSPYGTRKRPPLATGRNQTLSLHGGHVMIARRFASLVASALVLAACSGHAAPATPALPNPIIPGVVQKGGGGQFVQFTPNTIGALYSAIVQG